MEDDNDIKIECNLWHGVLLSMSMIPVANVSDTVEIHMWPADFTTIEA